MGKLLVGLLGIVTLAISTIATPAMAQEAGVTYWVHVHAGTCDSLGEIAAPLTDLMVPTGDRAGAEGATIAATSYSTVPLGLDALLASPYAIDVHRSTDDVTLACGEIGRVQDGSGAISVGLRPVNNSGFSGIAYLAADGGNPSQVTISTFLAETGVPGAAPAPDPGAGEGLDAATYGTTVRGQVTLVVGSLQRVDALFDNVQPGDQAWLDQLRAELSLWQILYSEAQELTPPAELADFHARYVEALALLDSAAPDVAEGVASGDQERLSQADAKIDQAIEAIRALDASDGGATPAAVTPAAATPAPGT